MAAEPRLLPTPWHHAIPRSHAHRYTVDQVGLACLPTTLLVVVSRSFVASQLPGNRICNSASYVQCHPWHAKPADFQGRQCARHIKPDSETRIPNTSGHINPHFLICLGYYCFTELAEQGLALTSCRSFVRIQPVPFAGTTQLETRRPMSPETGQRMAPSPMKSQENASILCDFECFQSSK